MFELKFSGGAELKLKFNGDGNAAAVLMTAAIAFAITSVTTVFE